MYLKTSTAHWICILIIMFYDTVKKHPRKCIADFKTSTCPTSKPMSQNHN